MTDINFQNIIDTFAAQVYNHTYRMLGNREDAEEATQDVFVKIAKGLGNFRGDAKLSTWIWRITTNVCLTRINKKSVKTTTLYDDELEILNDVDDNQVNPERYFIIEEEREQLIQFISKLNPRESAVITMFYFDGLDYNEISNILDLPKGSVATALHRGREKLRKLLLQEEGKEI